jgi:hypothetical protein
MAGASAIIFVLGIVPMVLFPSLVRNQFDMSSHQYVRVLTIAIFWGIVVYFPSSVIGLWLGGIVLGRLKGQTLVFIENDKESE